MSSANGNKYQNITVDPLFDNYKQTRHVFIDRLEVVLDFECNNAGLKKLSGFV
jgi:hypothetical protein